MKVYLVRLSALYILSVQTLRLPIIVDRVMRSGVSTVSTPPGEPTRSGEAEYSVLAGDPGGGDDGWTMRCAVRGLILVFITRYSGSFFRAIYRFSYV